MILGQWEVDCVFETKGTCTCIPKMIRPLTRLLPDSCLWAYNIIIMQLI